MADKNEKKTNHVSLREVDSELLEFENFSICSHVTRGYLKSERLTEYIFFSNGHVNTRLLRHKEKIQKMNTEKSIKRKNVPSTAVTVAKRRVRQCRAATKVV